MRVHVFQHVEHEDPGCLLLWARERGHVVTTTHFHKNESSPKEEMADLIIVMGGPMNVYEEEKYPWLADEKKSIEKMIRAGKPVMGICLGAQLIASVLGAKVRKNRVKEIGWFPITMSLLALKHDLFSGFPEMMDVFHWHGDTFDVPAGSFCLGSSECTQNQGFQFGDKVIGLQFHMECTKENVEKFLKEDTGELKEPSPYIQGPEKILGKADVLVRPMNELCYILMDRLAARTSL